MSQSRPIADRVEELLERITEVAPIPAAANRVIALTSKDDARIAEVAQAVAADSALAAETMRIANSSLYSGSAVIGDLEQAIMRLGLNELRNMAAAMAMIAAFRSDSKLSLRLHQQSVLSGALAGLSARALSTVPRGSAFLSGLLAEIGAMACLTADTEAYEQLWQAAGDDPAERERQETERYGTSSYEIGRRLLQRITLPEETCDAVGTPVDADADSLSDLARVCVFARTITPLLIAAGATRAFDAFREQLEATMERLALASLGTERMLDICVEAGRKSAAALRAR